MTDMQENNTAGAETTEIKMTFLTQTQTSWERMQAEDRPIFIYGMGDGAMKIMATMREFGIAIAGVFASDEFVRGHSFEGYRVHKLSEVEEAVEDFVIVLAFAAGFQALVDKIEALAQRHTLIVPDVPVTGGGLFTYYYCIEHSHDILDVYELLADDESRKVYANILNFKISGDIPPCRVTTTKRTLQKPHPPDHHRFSWIWGAYNGATIRERWNFPTENSNRIIAMSRQEKLKSSPNFIGHPPHLCYNCVRGVVDTERPLPPSPGGQSALSVTAVNARPLVDSILDGDRPPSSKWMSRARSVRQSGRHQHHFALWARKMMIPLSPA